MRELNACEIEAINGGMMATYSFCDFAGDATYGFFVFGGTVIGGATSFGMGAAAGGYAEHMVGSWAEDIVRHDAGC